MFSPFRVALLVFLFATRAALAQDTWLQIEAHPSLSEAREAASGFARRMQKVNGFRLGTTGWYAVALGPFGPGEAAQERRFLRESNLIPGDSFTTDGANFGQRFWPIGNDDPAAAEAQPAAPEPGIDVTELPAPGEQAIPSPLEGDTESREQALLSERLLSAPERRKLQLALRRTEFYRGPIDGAFGQTTRSAMAAWQGEQGAEATGVLTTDQRTALIAEYDSIVAAAGPEEVFETPAEARRSESALTGREREQIQEALRWEGYYDAAIDGAFGRGTRAAMEDWQAANGYPATGVLTTRQRTALIEEYNAVLEGLGMAVVRDDEAGIEIAMPQALIAFDSYEPPFAHYGPNDDAAWPKVLLISQRGDLNTLYGLYDIMQTLEIVPEDGPRTRRERNFTLVGENADFISHTEALLTSEGHVKGFTLIWPTGDEKRRGRVLDEMRASFTAIPGKVLDDSLAEPGENQSVDLLAGLEIRRPEKSRSGFYVNASGAVLTTSEVLGQCRRITLNDDVEAEVTARDDALGLALLTPRQSLAPMAYARFQAAVPRLQSKIAVAGYSFEGVLSAPTLSFGTVADLRGLAGEETVKRLDVAARPGDAGGPVLDGSGAVLGMLLPANSAAAEGTVLPDGVAFAADVETIAQFLSDKGPAPAASDGGEDLGTEALTLLAADMTVLVSCWN